MQTITNKKGQSFDQYMDEYSKANYPGVALTVDNVVLAIQDELPAVLLIERADFPYIGDWALPGGFVDKFETCEEAAERELQEEAGLLDIELEQLCTVSTLNRDPRCRTVSSCYLGVCAETLDLKSGDDASDAKWFCVDYVAKDNMYELVLKSDTKTLNAVMRVSRCLNGKIDINKTEIISQTGLAFDHAKIILYAIESLSN